MSAMWLMEEIRKSSYEIQVWREKGHLPSQMTLNYGVQLVGQLLPKIPHPFRGRLHFRFSKYVLYGSIIFNHRVSVSIVPQNFLAFSTKATNSGIIPSPNLMNKQPINPKGKLIR